MRRGLRAGVMPPSTAMTTLDRTTLAAALDGLRVPQLLMSVRRATSPWITVLTYHRVAPLEAAEMLDEGVVDVTPEQLERQLDVRAPLVPAS